MSSVLGVWMIELMNIPVFLSGNVIDLGDYKLQVAEACSGLRYLFPFLSLGVMTAYIFRGPLWQRLAIIVATVPITILMNSFRIALTGVLVQAYGPEHAEGALHFFEGWVVFLLCMAALFGVVAIFSLTRKPALNPLEALSAPELPQTSLNKNGAPRVGVLGALGAISIFFFGLSQFITVDQFIKPERKDFASIPDEFPGWHSEIVPLNERVAEVLGADDIIVANMTSPDGEFVNLYFSYLNARRDGRSWHSPRQCIPGGGWQITSHEVRERQLSNGATLNYNRLIIENRGERQLIYYWYDQRGRKIANEFVMKIWLIFDAIFKKRSDGAMVRLLTPVENAEGMAGAEQRLGAMIDRLEPVLPEYIPE